MTPVDGFFLFVTVVLVFYWLTPFGGGYKKNKQFNEKLTSRVYSLEKKTSRMQLTIVNLEKRIQQQTGENSNHLTNVIETEKVQNSVKKEPNEKRWLCQCGYKNPINAVRCVSCLEKRDVCEVNE